MTPQEINEAVARKLGWEKAGWTVPGTAGRYEVWKRGESETGGLRDYCRFIEAAWEIVEWMDKKDYLFTMSNDGVDPDKWLVWCDDPKTYAEANTAPMAICLAFLKLP